VGRNEKKQWRTRKDISPALEKLKKGKNKKKKKKTLTVRRKTGIRKGELSSHWD